MDDNDLKKEFLVDLANELDPSLDKYRSQIEALEDDLSSDRIAELKEYWNQEIPEEEEYEFLLRIEYSERLLLSLWTRIERLGKLRAQAAREHMLHYSISSDDTEKKD